MACNPGGDTPASTPSDDEEWLRVLAHRGKERPEVVGAVIDRFREAGVTPAQVERHLQDGGDTLYAAAGTAREGWADAFGGARAVALIAAEVSALMSHLVARAANVRAICVDALLDDYSAVTIAGALGVARQKVYDLAKPDLDPDYLTTSPWRSA